MALVIPNTRVLALRLQEPDKVINSFTKVKVVDGSVFGVDGRIVGVPHRNESLTMLRNLGIKTEGLEPIRTYYRYPALRGKFDPMAHQKTTAEFFTTHPRLFCLNEQRTGKTGSIVWASDFMMRERDVKRVLIVCTMSCMRPVWESEIFGITPNRSVAILHGSAAKRRELLAQDYDYYVINHDGIKVIRKELVEALKSGRIDLLVVDEISEFGDSRTDRYEVLYEMSKVAKRIWGLTGTPMSKGPEPVWALARLVEPKNVPPFITHWKHETMNKVSKYRWVPNIHAKAKIYAALQPAIRFAKADVLKDLPPLTHEHRDIALTGEQTAMLKELKKQGALLINGKRLTAANAAVMIGKVLQICAGAVKMDNGLVTRVNCKPRLDELDLLLEGTTAKFIVLSSYHATGDLIKEHLDKRYKTVLVDGRITGHERERRLAEFTNDPECRGIIAHPKVVGHGLEFSAADTCVWWCPHSSAEYVAQANQRMASISQKNAMGIYYLRSIGTEKAAYARVLTSLNEQASTLELFQNFVAELD